MKRPLIHLGAATLGAVVALAALPLQAETWRMSTQATADSPEGQAIQKFADLVGEYSGGDIDVRVYPNEQLGKIDTVLDQLGQGVVQVLSTSIGLLGRYDESMNYTTAPFLFEDYDQWANFMRSDLVKGWLKTAEDKSHAYVLGDLPAFPRGSYRVIASNTPVKSLEDLKGLKLRQWSNQLQVDAWTYLGSEVRILAWSEVYDGINRGMVQAVTSPIELIEPQKFYEVAPYVSRTNEYPQALAFLVNQKAFDKLADKDKAAVEKAHADAAVFMADLLEKNTEAAVATLKQEGVTFEDLDLGPIVAKMDEFYKGLDAEGKLPAGLLEAVADARTE